ncbi:MAG: hypothetical protein ABSH09_32490 [Bryobacteraceae bacterium]|jgi:hypothetical protein
MRRILKILAGIAAVYLAALASLYAIMTLPPERFARIVAALPSPLFMVLPFPPMWNIARAGHLSVGAPAPDFDLATLDKSARVRLSSFRGNKPVVLIFGSYT